MTKLLRFFLHFLGTTFLAAVPALAQQVVSIPKPVDGWMNIVNGAKPNTVFLLGPGVFHTSVPISISAVDVVLAGAGARTTTIIADAPMSALIQSTSRFVSLRDIVIDANHLAGVAIHEVMPTAPDTKALDGVQAKNAITDGIVIEGCQLCTFEGVSSFRNGRDGIILAGCNASIALGISSNWNGGRGIVLRTAVVNGVQFSGGMTMIGANAESNGAVQIEVEDTSSAVLIENPWIEVGQTETDGIRIEAPHVTVFGGRISGKSLDGKVAAVHLVGAGKDASIEGNVQMGNQALFSDFARIAR
ncbi:MAG: right-handed parallel beta-helix repeat-containing protein [Terracidiphilus sp.]|jgi:hypothetical protein